MDSGAIKESRGWPFKKKPKSHTHPRTHGTTHGTPPYPPGENNCVMRADARGDGTPEIGSPVHAAKVLG